jgi:hypothetical protein
LEQSSSLLWFSGPEGNCTLGSSTCEKKRRPGSLCEQISWPCRRTRAADFGSGVSVGLGVTGFLGCSASGLQGLCRVLQSKGVKPGPPEESILELKNHCGRIQTIKEIIPFPKPMVL